MTSENAGLITVLTTGDMAQMELAASILNEAGIPYLEKGGLSRRLGIYWFNASARFVEFQVSQADVPTARRLLSEGGLKPD
jgi:hypothetical protein